MLQSGCPEDTHSYVSVASKGIRVTRLVYQEDTAF
jgi:hypothetical protein